MILTAIMVLSMLAVALPSAFAQNTCPNQYSNASSSVQYFAAVDTTSSMPWFFAGAYTNYSVAYVSSGSRISSFVNETILSVSPNGNFELRELSFYNGHSTASYFNLTPSTISEAGLFINSTELSALNSGNNSMLTQFGSSGTYTIQVGYKFTDSMGTFKTDKVTGAFGGESATAYVDQKGGIVVGLVGMINQSGSAAYVYGNLTSTNIPTTLVNASSSSFILYFVVGGIAAVVVVAVVAYLILGRKKTLPPPETKQ